MKKILIIDDNADVLISLKLLLKKQSYIPLTANSPEKALRFLQTEPVHLILQDMNFKHNTTSGKEGLELLETLTKLYPHIPVLLFSAWAHIESVVEGMKRGAKDFFVKPWDNHDLIKRIENCLQLNVKQEKSSREELDKTYDFSAIIGESPQLVEQLDTVAMIAPTTASVLIRGENGTGKDLIAHAIHANSDRSKKPFVKVNIGGISDTLFHSEMFGHTKGAFTDAHETRNGRFEEAHGGTIFLDEIGDLSPDSQVKLLRVLQDGKFEKLGSGKTISVDVRVIAATNINLEEAMQNGTFREDLYYRLNTIELTLPPLRERGKDKRLLAQYFLNFYSQKYAKTVSLTPETEAFILAHKWTGNIRELQHAIERGVLMSKSGELILQNKSSTPDIQLPDVGSMSLDEIEKQMIVKALSETGNHMSKTAELLGINRTSLYRRLEKYKIDVNE